MGRGPWVACGSSFGVLHKSADSVGPAFCAFPAQAAQAARSLLRGESARHWRAQSPWELCAFSPPWSQPQFPCASVGCVRLVLGRWSLLQPSWQMSTIQNLRKSLVRNWKPVCSLVGDAVSGAEFALSPPSCLLPPEGDGLVCSWLALLGNCSVLPLFCEQASSVFSSQVNFFSLSCYPTV